MDDLFAAIAAFLRQQHPPQPQRPSRPPAPEARPKQRPAGFRCRFCAREVVAEGGGARFHARELWEAQSCAACHAERLADEASVAHSSLLPRQGGGAALAVTPRCRRCGAALDSRGLRLDRTRAIVERVCSACRAAGR